MYIAFTKFGLNMDALDLHAQSPAQCVRHPKTDVVNAYKICFTRLHEIKLLLLKEIKRNPVSHKIAVYRGWNWVEMVSPKM